MDLHLTGKVVLITGGTDGLGAALADGLAEEGARVAVCGRDRNRLAATEQRLRDAGADALVVQADVTSLADLEQFFDAAISRWGRLDGLVNNAGKSAAGRIDQVSDDDWIADLNLKVLAAVRCTRLAVPHLIAAGGGSIVNVLNTGAKAPGAGSLPTTEPDAPTSLPASKATSPAPQPRSRTRMPGSIPALRNRRSVVGRRIAAWSIRRRISAGECPRM